MASESDGRDATTGEPDASPPIRFAPGSPKSPPHHERLVFRLTLLAGLPGVIASMVLLWRHNYSAKVQWTLGLVVIGGWIITALVLRERVVRPLQTLSNMLAALREGDYSIRARGADREDALGLAFLESNLLGETLRLQRLGAMEATALLRTVMAEIDVAVFAFDDEDRLRLVNRAGERLIGQPEERLLGRTAEQAGLAGSLQGPLPRTMDVTFPGGAGRWEVRRGSFRQDGRPHTLLVLADVSKTLREEELQAWQRLVRVLSHEINNSLAPIKSITGSLTLLLDRQPRPADADDDLRRGLSVIGGRSEALVRFMSAYARLARLPAPNMVPLEVGLWVRRVAALETRMPVIVGGGPPGDAARRRRPARSAADQSRPQRGRCIARDAWCGTHSLAAAARRARIAGGRRRTGHREQRESLRALLHDEAAGLRHRPRALPADRRSPRRIVVAREPRGSSRLGRHLAARRRRVVSRARRAPAISII